MWTCLKVVRNLRHGGIVENAPQEVRSFRYGVKSVAVATGNRVHIRSKSMVATFWIGEEA